MAPVPHLLFEPHVLPVESGMIIPAFPTSDSEDHKMKEATTQGFGNREMLYKARDCHDIIALSVVGDEGESWLASLQEMASSVDIVE